MKDTKKEMRFSHDSRSPVTEQRGSAKILGADFQPKSHEGRGEKHRRNLCVPRVSVVLSGCFLSVFSWLVDLNSVPEIQQRGD